MRLARAAIRMNQNYSSIGKNNFICFASRMLKFEEQPFGAAIIGTGLYK